MAWSKNRPVGGNPVSAGDDVIRENFEYIEDTLGSAKSLGASLDAFDGSGHTGYVILRAGTAAELAVGLTPLPVAGTIYIVTDTTPPIFKRFDGADWVIIGGGEDYLWRDNAPDEAQRTMSDRLVVASTDTVITGLSSDKHKIWLEDAMTNQIMEVVRVADDDWYLQVMEDTALSKLVTVAALAPLIATALEPAYDSGNQTVAADTSNSHEHSLGGGIPTLVHAVLRCIGDEEGYVEDDEVLLPCASWYRETAYYEIGISVWFNATHMEWRVANDGLWLIDEAGGRFEVDYAKWKLVVRAWEF